MIEQSLTVTVVDQNGEPAEGIDVEEGHPDAEPTVKATDENGQAVFTSVTSDSTDATMTEVHVNGETYPASFHADGQELMVELEDGQDGDENGGTTEDESALALA